MLQRGRRMPRESTSSVHELALPVEQELRVAPRALDETAIAVERADAPGRLPPRAWGVATALFVSTYVTMWTFVHTYVDRHPCIGHPRDPLYALIPCDGRWSFVSHELYGFVTFASLAGLVLGCVRGDHVPLVRYGAALSFQAIERSACMLLVPLCRANVTPGTCAETSVPTFHVGGLSIPWHPWASNDLLFSGHVGELILLLAATPGWPRWARTGLIAYQIVQVYALIATRGHFTIDVLLAIPCAFFADRLAVRMLSALSPRPAFVKA
jgi:hypothetical protein